MLTMATALWASRAWMEPTTVVQPDGTQLTIVPHGDVHMHWIETTDGVLLMHHEGGYYVAEVGADGNMTRSSLLAHERQQRSSEELQACQRQQQQKARFVMQAGRTVEQSRRAQVTGTGYFPHTGSPKCLVILVNFSDVKFTNADPMKQFTQYINGETQENLGQNEDKNTVGVKKYFEQSSGGKFTPEFDIVGPFDLPHTAAYYGEENGSSHDSRYGEFCKDAISAADATVDFSKYDNDGNGQAELVCVVFAGYGQSNNTTLPNTIWPKCGYQGVTTTDKTADGKTVTVGYMNCNAELRKSGLTDINGIGIFVHEFSHGMGLPDMYAIEGSAASKCDNQTMEFFDLMDYGEYANNGYSPVPYTAWEREAMGWMEVEQLTETTAGLELTPVISGGKAYKFGNGVNDEEFIYIENVQARNNDTRTLGHPYGHGLLAYHVAYASHSVNMADYPNSVAAKPRMAVVPAGGLLISGYRFVSGNNPTTADKPYTQSEYLEAVRRATFPGNAGVAQLTDAQALPNYMFYNHAEGGTSQTGFNLTDIKENEETKVVTLNFWKGNPTAITSASRAVSAGADACYTLDGRRLSGEPQRSGLYIRNGKKFVK